MGKYRATCEYVQDGDTFRTAKQNWIRLARHDALEEASPNYANAKNLLMNYKRSFFVLVSEVEF